MGVIFILLCLTEVCQLVIAFDFESFARVGLDNSDVVVFDYFYFNANRIRSIHVGIVWEMNSYYLLDVVLFVIILLKEILNVLVLRQGELRIR